MIGTDCQNIGTAPGTAAHDSLPQGVEALVGREFVHFKGGHYRLRGFAKDSETLQSMVVYEALYGEGGLWVRPAKMFFENVEKPGYSGPRFRLCTDCEA